MKWVTTDLIRGDVFFWDEIMAGALIAAIPVAIACNPFVDRFIAGITGGAVKQVSIVRLEPRVIKLTPGCDTMSSTQRCPGLDRG